MSTPILRAAWRGQYGSRRNSLPIMTASAMPVETICSACAGLVIMPKAPVAMPASRRTAAAKGVGNPGPAVLFASGSVPPLEQSILLMPIVFSSRASTMVCCRFHPPSTQSMAETRTSTGNLSGHSSRTAQATERGNRRRFSGMQLPVPWTRSRYQRARSVLPGKPRWLPSSPGRRLRSRDSQCAPDTIPSAFHRRRNTGTSGSRRSGS